MKNCGDCVVRDNLIWTTSRAEIHFWVCFSKGHPACARVVSWLDQELSEQQFLCSLHMYSTHTGTYGVSDFLFCSTKFEDPFWHRAQFISWLQYRLLEPERMLYFEGDAAGEKLLLFVLDCKSPSSTQKKGWLNDQRNAFKKHENKAKAFPCCSNAYSKGNTMCFTMTINGLIVKHFYWAVQAPISDAGFQLLP